MMILNFKSNHKAGRSKSSGFCSLLYLNLIHNTGNLFLFILLSIKVARQDAKCYNLKEETKKTYVMYKVWYREFSRISNIDIAIIEKWIAFRDRDALNSNPVSVWSFRLSYVQHAFGLKIWLILRKICIYIYWKQTTRIIKRNHRNHRKMKKKIFDSIKPHGHVKKILYIYILIYINHKEQNRLIILREKKNYLRKFSSHTFVYNLRIINCMWNNRMIKHICYIIEFETIENKNKSPVLCNILCNITPLLLIFQTVQLIAYV